MASLPPTVKTNTATIIIGIAFILIELMVGVSWSQNTTLSLPEVRADGGPSDECEDAAVTSFTGGNGSSRSYTDAQGRLVTGVCIKSGSNMFGDSHSAYLTNGSYENGCYTVSGVGTSTVTVTKNFDGNSCKDISHLDIQLAIPTPTPTPSPSPTPTPTPSPSPSPIPTPSPTPTPTPSASPTPTPSPSPTPTPTPTPTPSQRITPTPSPSPTPTPDGSGGSIGDGDQGPGGDCCAHDDDKHPDNQPKQLTSVDGGQVLGTQATPVPLRVPATGASFAINFMIAGAAASLTAFLSKVRI